MTPEEKRQAIIAEVQRRREWALVGIKTLTQYAEVNERLMDAFKGMETEEIIEKYPSLIGPVLTVGNLNIDAIGNVSEPFTYV